MQKREAVYHQLVRIAVVKKVIDDDQNPNLANVWAASADLEVNQEVLVPTDGEGELLDMKIQ